jgi:hypothetical protein
MLEIDGQIWQSPTSFAVLGLTASGRLTIGQETFSGSVTAGTASYPLRSLNRHNDASSANGLTLFTPALGAALPLSGAAVAFLRPTARSRHVFTVESVQSGVTTLPVLVNQDALVGNGAAAAWLLAHLERGATLAVSEQIAPDDTLVQAIGGGALLLKDGAFYQDTHAPAPKTSSPLTAIGVSRDGRHVLLAVCDGRQTDPERTTLPCSFFSFLSPFGLRSHLWPVAPVMAPRVATSAASLF